MRVLILAAGLLATAAPAQPPADKWHAEGRAIYQHAIEVPTVAGRGKVPELAEWLKAKFAAAGLTDAVIKPYDDSADLIVRWKAEGKPMQKPILLLAHLDVVEAKAADWPRDPFKLVEEGGYFYGRGTLDDKQGVTAVTTAILRLKAEGFKPRRDIIILFSGDEETDGKGADLAATEWRSLIDAEYALNADAGGGAKGPDGKLLGFAFQTSEKTYADYTLTVTNPGGHSSRPRPDNAIYELAAGLTKLADYRFQPMMDDTTRAYFEVRQKSETGKLGDAMRAWLKNPADGAAADVIEADPLEVGGTRTRCVATRLAGGHANNALPQTATANVNCRIFPGTTPQAIEAELQSILGKGVTVKLVGNPKYSGASPLRADVLKAYTDSVRRRFPGALVVPKMEAGATDGLYLRAAGIPTYGVDGTWIVVPDDERAHGLNERYPVQALYDNIDHWHDMVAALAR
ncbi:MAG: hypothetical protein DI623_09885 [Sphingomonas sanxanigenens]|uniref:Peptidase M20 dimerisation domain-containing protein n=1 Tax=Sphingomonas sanxanigenens TaxID=397260 RepID=A0A2W5C2X3_9SPHN|nr:MAG: hypothetical protein DI623_09885 [Sphingomonas sanxanigenens]